MMKPHFRVIICIIKFSCSNAYGMDGGKMYLASFKFVDELKEELFLNGIKHTCYQSFYPFGVLSAHHLERLDFEPVTILYGGNGRFHPVYRC